MAWNPDLDGNGKLKDAIGGCCHGLNVQDFIVTTTRLQEKRWRPSKKKKLPAKKKTSCLHCF